MKKIGIPSLVLLLTVSLLLACCTVTGEEATGSMYEKMVIYLLIALTLFAINLISFGAGESESKEVARYRELVRGAPPLPLSAEHLTFGPVYVWDSRTSFRKLIFREDGIVSESKIVTENGIDPVVVPSGTWTLTAAGELQIIPDATGRERCYCRISEDGYHLATLMRCRDRAEPWYLGPNALARVQVSCFGYPQSVPPSRKFSRSLLSGKKVYWATYPCLMLTAASEVFVNQETAYGVITFHDDGTLSKSINNPIDAAPDYTESMTGSWTSEAEQGVLTISVGSYSAAVTILLDNEPESALVVGTTAGNELWFLDAEAGRDSLCNYLSVALYLDESKRSFFA